MKVGDIVRYLNAVGGGKVTKIDDKIAYVEEPDALKHRFLSANAW